ncbi:MAG TPA: UvrD-helicase domain-containing protein, partial [Candidatus Hydrogenedentes bacterium]|nr:UvrD-helicase domain-containing protein [Candidatus Hydrogenedentota bacterium]
MKWTDAQAEAIQTTGEDLCVTASAGSGKTAVLVERVLHLVIECNVPLERIVAITFTEKAAAEMKDRLRSECRAREQSGSKEGLDRWRNLARQVESAHMSTIHAFCARLLRQYALEYRITPPLDPDFAVVDDAESRLLRTEVVDTAIEELLERPHDATMRLATHYGVYQLKEMLERFLRNPVTASRLLSNEQFSSPERLLKFWRVRVEETCRARLLNLSKSAVFYNYLRKFKEFDGRCGIPTDGREQFRRTCIQLMEEVGQLRDPLLIEQLIMACIEERIPTTRKANWPSEEVFEELKKTQEAFKGYLREFLMPDHDPDVEQRSAELTRDAVACFRAVFEYYREAKTSRNVLDFTDLILLTLDMLQGQPELRERIARGIDHLLIDEFQDTDFEQYEIARLLRYTPAPPELFIVGDAKQSIYRFRGAEVEVFEAAKQESRTIGLHRNFRTVPEIVSFINDIFDRSGILEAVESPFMPADAHRAATGECRVHVLIPDAPEDKELSAQRRMREAAMIGDWIAAAHSGQLDVQVQAKGSDTTRKAAFGDMALLFRALSDIRIYERALAERHIPFHVIAGKGFYERQEVLDLRNLLEAVVDPWHEPALLGFLRSPMAGLDDDSILAICAGPGPVAALLEDGTPPDFRQTAGLDHARRMFRDLRAERERPLPDFVRYVLERTGYEAMVAGLFLGDQRACNVRKVMQLAETFVKTRRPRLSAFVRYLDDVASAEIDEGEASLQAEGSDEVTLMSIHKSKGLEFPIVILPDLSRGSHQGGNVGRVVFHRDFGIVARPYNPASERQTEPQIYTVMKRDEEAKEEAERARVLYVAMTRARDWLVLSGTVASGKSPRPAPDSLLEPIASELDVLNRGDGALLSGEGWTALVRRSTTPAAIDAPAPEPAL